MHQDILGLNYVVMDKTTHESTNPIIINDFVASISNTTIADKITKQMWYAPRTLQDVFKKALMLEDGLQLAEWCPYMETSTSYAGFHRCTRTMQP